MKRCSFCAEEIQDAAIVCRYCNRDLPTVGPNVSMSGTPSPPVASVSSPIPPQRRLSLPKKIAWGIGVFFALGVLINAINEPSSSTNDASPPAPVRSSSSDTEASAELRQPEKPATPADRATDLEDYLRDNFSETSWYPHITAVKVMWGAAWIDTDIYPDEDAREPAASICMAVSGYVYSNQDSLGLTGLRVAASTGERLVMRTSISDRC